MLSLFLSFEWLICIIDKQYSCSASGVPDYLGVNTPSIYNAGVNTADTGIFVYDSYCLPYIASI
jgi:hypothetical protein